MHLFRVRVPPAFCMKSGYDCVRPGAAGDAGDVRSDLPIIGARAWTWEHQALVRARVVYGDPQLTAHF
ncbi:hypothetical protein ACNKHV_19280 [Shigella flexneri]